MTVRIGIFGGTFDPVHTGHVQLALHVQSALALSQVRLMPAHIPPHRATPSVGPLQRAEMVALAISAYPELSLDDRELHRHSASYTIDSLRELRAEVGPQVGLYFVMGMDSLNALSTWRQWQQLTDYAHLVVLARPGQHWPSGDSALTAWLAARLATPEQAQSTACGGVISLEANCAESATQVRADLRQGRTQHRWLAPSVSDYIARHHLYTHQG